MPTDDPTTPRPRGEGGMPTRELLLAAVIRIRQDLARVERLTEVLGTNQPVPAEVVRAIQTLQDWSAELVRAGRPKPPNR